MLPYPLHSPITLVHPVKRNKNHVVGYCWSILWNTWTCLNVILVTFAAPYTDISIAVQYLWIYCSLGQCGPVANVWSNLPIADLDIVDLSNSRFIWYIHSSILTCALWNGSEWLCQLTSRGSYQNAYTVQITISSECVTSDQFPFIVGVHIIWITDHCLCTDHCTEPWLMGASRIQSME